MVLSVAVGKINIMKTYTTFPILEDTSEAVLLIKLEMMRYAN